MRPRTALLTAALTAAIGALTLAPTANAGSGGPLRPGPYVALGDSYSAGAGILPLDPAANPQCTRALVNYPHLLAQQLPGRALRDVTCSGATTDDFYAPQFSGVGPQLDAVSADAALVTMTIGGNDGGVFMSVVEDCSAAGAGTLGQGSPCKDQYGSRFTDTIATLTYPNLVRALTDVHARAPKAKVAILSYPQVMPQTGPGCYPVMPIATGDVDYVNGIERALNDAVRRAAAATGTAFVDTFGPSAGHDACQPIGTRWVEPVLGTNFVPVHPNADGEAAMASITAAALRL
jgi:lysophospholipase L1-like esterase